MGRKKRFTGIFLPLLILGLLTSCGREEYVVEYGVDGYVYPSRKLWSAQDVDDLQVADDWLYYIEKDAGGAKVKRVSVAALTGRGGELDFSGAEILAVFSETLIALPEGAGEYGEDIDFLALMDDGSGSGGIGVGDYEKRYGSLSLEGYALSSDGDLYCYLQARQGTYYDMNPAGGVLCGQSGEGSRLFCLYLSQMLDFAVDAGGRVMVLTGDGIQVLDREGRRMGEISTTGYHMAGKPAGEELFADSEGRIYYSMWDEGYVRTTYRMVGEEDFRLEDAGKFLGDGTMKHSPAPEGKLFLYCNAESFLYRYDRETGSGEKVLRWDESGLENSGVSSVTEVTPDIFLVSYVGSFMGESGIYQLTRTPVEELPEKESVVIASPFHSPSLQRAMIRFNARSDTYRVMLDDYGAWFSTEEGRWMCPQLDAALVSENPPDILDLGAFNIPKYAKKGVLEDLYPYIEGSSILDLGDIPDNLLEGLTFDEKLVCMPLKLTVQSVFARASQVEGVDSWTMEDVYRLAEGHPESVGGLVDFGYGKRAEGGWLLKEFCAPYYLEEFVDWENWTCSFDSDDFRRLVEWTRKYGWMPEHVEEQMEAAVYFDTYIPEDALLVSKLWLGFSSLAQVELQYGEKACLVGYPTHDGRRYFPALINEALGITSNSVHKNGAWEFLEYYLQSDLMSGIPASKAKIKELYDKETTPDYVKGAVGEDGKPQMSRKGSIGVGLEMVPYYVIPVEQADAVLEAIEQADFRPRSEEEEMIIKIVVEEAESYFCGDKNLKEVTGLIQNRVQLILDEVKP